MQDLLNAHPSLALLIGFMSAHFGHLTWGQVKRAGAFWESMHGWRGLKQFWLTGNPVPPPNDLTAKPENAEQHETKS